jgi:hypothetical protein
MGTPSSSVTRDQFVKKCSPTLFFFGQNLYSTFDRGEKEGPK